MHIVCCDHDEQDRGIEEKGRTRDEASVNGPITRCRESTYVWPFAFTFTFMRQPVQSSPVQCSYYAAAGENCGDTTGSGTLLSSLP